MSVKYDTEEIVQKKFNLKKLSEYKSNPDFDYSEEVAHVDESFLEQVFNWFYRVFLKFLSWLFGVEKATGILAFFFSALPYVLIAILLFLILKFFLKVKTNPLISEPKNNSTVQISEEEELINNKNLEAFIQKAISNQNFRLAVRYLYINVLRSLEERKIINWEQQKTNEDYIKEINSHELKASFKKITHLYDFVWYGKFDINEVEFFKIQSVFDNTIKLIQH